MGNIMIGSKFPRLEVVTTHGKKVLPDDYKGMWFLLFSHPADFTPVCTTEFYAFQKRFDKFKELNTELIGLSIDQVFSHIKWEEWIKDNLGEQIEFPIIADDRGKVAETLGMLPQQGSSTVRAVFIVDPSSVIRAMLFYPQELGRNMDEFLRMMKAFQVADEQKVAMPANWPENELVGDHVIIPPPRDVTTAAERLKKAKEGELECYDWWLCHKKPQY
ncbi:MAG: peroxiredoxin [Halobacteriota archaeon]